MTNTIIPGKRERPIVIDAGGRIPAGGTTGQALVKASNSDYATEWATIASGGGSGGQDFATRAALVAANAATPGLGLADGQIVTAAGLAYRRLAVSSAISDLPGWVPNDVATPEHFGAIADGVADDRATFIAAEAYGVWPIRLSGSYYLSSNTGNTGAIYEIDSDASVAMGVGSFQPARYDNNDANTFLQRVNFASSNPVPSGEPVTYTILETGLTQDFYTINQWGRQNMVDPDIQNNRTGAYQVRNRFLHSGEGDGYPRFDQVSVLPHSRIGSATSWKAQNSGGLSGGQSLALGSKVNLYGHGDIVLRDDGYTDVSMLGLVTFLERDGANSGDYIIPRIGHFLRSTGAEEIDANILAGGPTKVAFDATKATTSWGALAMKSGQSILFDAVEGTSSGQFSAASPGTYAISKPSGVAAIVATRGADDAHLFRVQGSSTSARAAVGAQGAVAYFSAHTNIAENTTLSLRTADMGTMADRFVITSTGRARLGGTVISSGAFLDVQSTTGGVGFPRMTTAQRDAISAPVDGIVVYNTTTAQLNLRANGAWEAVGRRTESIIIAVGDETTPITTGTAKVTFRMPYPFNLSAVRASLTGASSSGNPTVDINEAGVSILSTKLSIDSGERTSTTATTAAVISDGSLADDAEMTIDIDTAGTGATGLKVYLIGSQP